MRAFGLFLGGSKRNDPVRLVDPRPIPDYGNKDMESGDAGKDGFTVLSKASPAAQGCAPPVAGTLGPAYQGPASDWEQ